MRQYIVRGKMLIGVYMKVQASSMDEACRIAASLEHRSRVCMNTMHPQSDDGDLCNPVSYEWLPNFDGEDCMPTIESAEVTDD